jgi:Lon protease-like protein
MDNKVFLFPLRDTLLFQKVTLPFHIFESRYRLMIKESIDRNIPIAVLPLNENNRYENAVCIAGYPHILTTYDDGRMDIYITGTQKCRLTHILQEDPFHVFEFINLKEKFQVGEIHIPDLECLNNMLLSWSNNFLASAEQRQSFINNLEDVELMINYCGVFLVNEIKFKEALIRAETLSKKIEILFKAIGPKELALGPFLPTLKF